MCVLFIYFFKTELLVSLIFFFLFFLEVFISPLIFIISCFLLSLDIFYSFCSFYRYKVGLFILDFFLFLREAFISIYFPLKTQNTVFALAHRFCVIGFMCLQVFFVVVSLISCSFVV